MRRAEGGGDFVVTDGPAEQFISGLAMEASAALPQTNRVAY